MEHVNRSFDLADLLDWLNGKDETEWAFHIDLLAEIIFDLKKCLPAMVHQRVVPAEATAILLAMPHLITMMAAMYGGNREEALEFGETALELLAEDCSTQTYTLEDFSATPEPAEVFQR